MSATFEKIKSKVKEIEESKSKLENDIKEIESGYKSSIEQFNTKNTELLSEIESYKANLDSETRKVTEELAKIKLENEANVNTLNAEFDQQKESLRNEIVQITNERDKYFNDTITFKAELDDYSAQNQTVNIFQLFNQIDVLKCINNKLFIAKRENKASM